MGGEPGILCQECDWKVLQMHWEATWWNQTENRQPLYMSCFEKKPLIEVGAKYWYWENVNRQGNAKSRTPIRMGDWKRNAINFVSHCG